MKNKIQKKFFFSLIEIIIATSLFGILIFSTTSLFFRYHQLSSKLNLIRPKVLERSLFFKKMTAISNTIDKKSINTKSDNYKDYISFTFDNGIIDNAALSGACLCEIYRTEQQKIVYKISSNHHEHPRDILEGISSFTTKTDGNILYMFLVDTNNQKLTYAFTIPKESN